MKADDLLLRIKESCYTSGTPNYAEIMRLIQEDKDAFFHVPDAVQSIYRALEEGEKIIHARLRQQTVVRSIGTSYRSLCIILDLMERLDSSMGHDISRLQEILKGQPLSEANRRYLGGLAQQKRPVMERLEAAKGQIPAERELLKLYVQATIVEYLQPAIGEEAVKGILSRMGL